MLSDTLTPLVFPVLLVAFLGVLQIWLWRQDRSLSVLAIWGAAHLVAAVGLVLLAGRGFFPNRLSIDAANAIIVLSYALVWVGARQFERRPVSIAVALGGAIIWLAACQVPEFYLSLSNRVAGGSAIVAVYDLLTMREFLRKRTDAALPSRRALAVVFSAHAYIQGTRAVAALTLGFDQAVFSLPVSTWMALSAMAGVVLVAGASVLLIAVAKEAAEQRSTAILAMARDTADRANIAKSRFLARMSHELRTPLNSVMGMAQALTRDPLLRGEQRERAVLLEQAGRHLLAIVNDILDLARVEAGKFELAPKPALVGDIIHGAVDLVSETAAAKGVALNLQLAADMPVAVLADPLRVRQILLNLLGNAIKFTPSDGRVSLSVSQLGPVGGLRLTVADTGPGVPAEITPYLFQDFARRPVSEATSEGTGLGLAISMSLAQTMGGTISYQPGPRGIGSIFTVELPLPNAAPPAEPSPSPSASPRSQPGLRVLVVDDVPSNRKLAEVLLQQAGFAVELAAGGASAVAALENGPVPDIVLMDVYMPGIDGLMATQRIRALPGPAGRVPIIALTADASSERAQACRDAGMDGYITKPLDFAELVAAITEAVPQAAVALPACRTGIRTHSVVRR